MAKVIDPDPVAKVEYTNPNEYRIAHAIWQEAVEYHQQVVEEYAEAEVALTGAVDAVKSAEARMREAQAGLTRWIVDGKDNDF